MQVLKHKYRLYPNKEQETKLYQFCGSQRYIWNHFLAKEQTQYSTDKTFRFFNQNCKDLTELKKTTEWLQEIPATSLQQTLRYLNRALTQSFPKNKNSSRKGFPKFKKRKNFNGSFSLTMVNSKKSLKNGKFYVNLHTGIDVVLHRALPSDFASCQVKQEANKWFVIFTCKKDKEITKPIKKTTGIDLNSKSFVTIDSVFPIPKYLNENQVRIRELQRQLSRKTFGSKNKMQCQLKLQKIHYRIRQKRSDFFHKLSKALVDSYDLITIEDLDVKSIQHKFGKVIADNGFSMFRAFLTYKCELYGKTIVVADRYFPSSQKCSLCGSITKHRLDQRTYTCNHCGFEIDRDLNAAINLNHLGQELADFKPVDPNALNIDSVMAVLMGIDQKQEAIDSSGQW